MDPIITNLKRASIELILLSILKEEDMYGYQLAGEIKKEPTTNYLFSKVLCIQFLIV